MRVEDYLGAIMYCSELVYSAVHATICYIWTGLKVDILGTKSPNS